MAFQARAAQSVRPAQPSRTGWSMSLPVTLGSRTASRGTFFWHSAHQIREVETGEDYEGRTMKALRGSTLTLAVLALTGYALAQRGTGPAGPPSATQAPSEAMGSLDFLE